MKTIPEKSAYFGALKTCEFLKLKDIPLSALTGPRWKKVELLSWLLWTLANILCPSGRDGYQ